MNIRVDLNYHINDGVEVVFRSPVDCSQVTGLKVYYPKNGNMVAHEFAFADAHGNNVGDIDHLFAENVVVKVILDVTTSMAFVQNADTNAYLEGRFAELKEATDKLCPAFVESGSVVTCEPVERYPLEVVSKIAPVQSGSGDPSPNNIRSISGYDKVKLTQCGKNLWPFESAVTTETNRAGNFKFSSLPHGVPLTVSADITKYPNDTATATRVKFACTYTDGTRSENESAYDTTGAERDGVSRKKTATITIDPDKTIQELWVNLLDYSGQNGRNAKAENIQLEIGTAATAYEPHREETFELDLGQTVYGGSLDWNTGVLTITHNYLIFDGNEPFEQEGICQFTVIQGGKAPCIGMCSHYTCLTSEQYDATEIGCYLGNRDFITFCTDFDTIDLLNEYLAEQHASGTPVKCVYQLEVPITVQLTPQEITALSGINTLYSDTGDTDVAGKADPVAIIKNLQNRLAALEAAIVNNA